MKNKDSWERKIKMNKRTYIKTKRLWAKFIIFPASIQKIYFPRKIIHLRSRQLSIPLPCHCEYRSSKKANGQQTDEEGEMRSREWEVRSFLFVSLFRIISVFTFCCWDENFFYLSFSRFQFEFFIHSLYMNITSPFRCCVLPFAIA